MANVQKNPEMQERVYATLQAPHYETAQSGNGSLPSEYQTYDYTTIYEDPTSPSYVVRQLLKVFNIHNGNVRVCGVLLQSEVYSTGSVFDSAGTYVPTLVSSSGGFHIW